MIISDAYALHPNPQLHSPAHPCSASQHQHKIITKLAPHEHAQHVLANSGPSHISQHHGLIKLTHEGTASISISSDETIVASNDWNICLDDDDDERISAQTNDASSCRISARARRLKHGVVSVPKNRTISHFLLPLSVDPPNENGRRHKYPIPQLTISTIQQASHEVTMPMLTSPETVSMSPSILRTPNTSPISNGDNHDRDATPKPLPPRSFIPDAELFQGIGDQNIAAEHAVHTTRSTSSTHRMFFGGSFPELKRWADNEAEGHNRLDV